MFNLFKKTVEKSSYESWAKMCDDVAKVAALAAPVIIYGNSMLAMKITNVILLILTAYFFLRGGREFRRKSEEM